MQLALHHVNTYVDCEQLIEHVERYRRAGFATSERHLKHPLGLEIGGLKFGRECVELLAVDDVDKYLARAQVNDKIVCAAHRPFGIAFRSPDVQELRARCAARGYELPDPIEMSVGDGDRAIPVRIVQIPLKMLRGASCYILEVADPTPVRGENGMCGLAGITLVSEEASERVAQWRAFFGLDDADSSDTHTVRVGAHAIRWLQPAEFERTYGEVWQPARHPLGEIAILDVISDDVARTREYLSRADRSWTEIENGLLIPPFEEDGLRFAVRARAPAAA